MLFRSLLRTGWSSRWPDRAAYLGTDLAGREAVTELHFPGLAPAAARWLAEERSVDAVGIDTPSMDHGDSKELEGHRVLYDGGVAILENLDLSRVPPGDYELIALPLRIVGGDSSPVSAIWIARSSSTIRMRAFTTALPPRAVAWAG